jgi:preprotein translocase subunit SecA
VGAGALAAAAAAAGVAGGAQVVQGQAEDGEEEFMPVVEQRVVDDEHQLGRNDPCWCGSGQKFKRCHGG